MNLNAAMNTQMTERFNVAGALLVKLFGDHDARSTEFSNAGRAACATSASQSAMYGRMFFVALGLVGAVGAAAIYGVGGHLVIAAPSRSARSSRWPRSSPGSTSR